MAAAPTSGSSIPEAELLAANTDAWVFMQMCLYLWVSCASKALGLKQKPFSGWLKGVLNVSVGRWEEVGPTTDCVRRVRASLEEQRDMSKVLEAGPDWRGQRRGRK